MAISSHSKACRDAIQQLAHVAEGPWADDQLRRFNVWAANSSALATGRAYHFSMDWRLRENEHLASFLVRQIELLTTYVMLLAKIAADKNNTINLQHPSPPSANDGPRSPSSSSSSTSSSSYPQPESVSGLSLNSLSDNLDNVSRTQYFIEEILDQIIRLTIFVRRAGWQDRHSKAALYEDIRDGINLTSDYREEAVLLVKYHFPEASGILQERLAESLSLRQRQLAYFRAQKHDRQFLTDALEAAEESNPAVDLNKNDGGRMMQMGETTRPLKIAADAQLMPQIGATGYNLMSASAIQPGLTRSVVFAPSSVRSSKPTSRSKLWFPSLSISQTSITSKEFECPICFLILPIEKSDTEKWHQHVLHDAQPFVCVFEHCHSPHTLYRSMSKWIEHLMEKHAQQKWLCAVASHPEMSFDTGNEYKSHMEIEHPNLVKENDLSILARKSSFVAHWTDLLPACPLCNYTPDDLASRSRTLQYHIVDHLENLAMQVILQLYDAKPDSGNSEVGYQSLAAGQIDARDQGSRAANDELFPWSLWTSSDGNQSINDYSSFDDGSEGHSLSSDFNWDAIFSDSRVRSREAHPGQLQDEILKSFINHNRGHLSVTNTSKYSRYMADLSRHNPEGGFKNGRRSRLRIIKNSFDWLLRHPHYQKWMNDPETPLLHIVGAPGTGKTTLAEFIAEKLEQHSIEAPGRIFAYCFCNALDGMRNSAEAVISSLLWHVFTKQPQLFEIMQGSPDISDSLYIKGFANLQAVLWKLVAKEIIGNIYILVDGLDECEQVSKELLLGSLVGMVQLQGHKSYVSIILTGSPFSDFDRVLSTIDNRLTIILPSETSEVMQQFIETIFNELYQTNGWMPGQVRSTVDLLVERAMGNFLWITIVLEELFKVRSPAMVIETIREIPIGLANLYNQVLTNVDNNRIIVMERTLMLIYAAYRPLYLPEIGMALAIRDPKRDLSRLPTSSTVEGFKESYKLCGPILQLDKESNTIHFIHSTARAYLGSFGSKADTENRISSIYKTHLYLFEICISVLSTKDLDQYAEEMCSETERQAHWWEELDPLPPLVSYAAENWHLHAQSMGDAFIEEYFSMRKMLQLLSNRPQLFYSWMRLAADDGKLFTLDYMLNRCNASVDAANKNDMTPLFLAARGGREAVIQLLLEKSANIDIKDNDGRTALFLAASYGHEDVVQLLIEKGANIGIKDNDGRTALSLATNYGREDVVRLLLEKGANIDIKDNDGRTALSLAAKDGFDVIVRLLLENGADIDIKDKDGRAALSLAKEEGHEAVIRLLQSATDLLPIVISGPSGVGKGTLINVLFTRHPNTFTLPISHTTRKLRLGETNGGEYYFVTLEEFEKMIEERAFWEHAEFGGSRYGTSKKMLWALRASGKRVLLSVEMEGVKQLKSSEVKADFVFIAPPSIEVLKSRLSGRGTETEATILTRVVQARLEIEYSQTEGAYDIIVINDDLEKAYGNLEAFLFRKGMPEQSPSTNKNTGSNQLTQFDTIFIIDDSRSMQEPANFSEDSKSKWDGITRSVQYIAKIIAAYEADGVGINFLISTELNQTNVTSEQEVLNVLSRVNVEQGSRGTFFEPALAGILIPFIASYESTTNRPKKLKIIILTDGRADDPEALEELLIHIGQQLDKMDAPRSQVVIKFIQVGEDIEAARYLDYLEDQMGEKFSTREFIETYTSATLDGTQYSLENLRAILLITKNSSLD